MASEIVVPLLHKSKADRRAEPPQPQPRSVQRPRRRDPAPVRRARRHRARQRAALRAEPARRRSARDAGRDRPRGRVRARPRSAVRAHRAAHQARHRLPDVRHPAPQRRRRARDQAGACTSARSATCRASSSAKGIVGYAALHREPVLVSDVVAGSALHPASCPTSAPSWRSRC